MYRLAASILYDEDESKDVVSEVFARLMASDVTLRPDTAEAYLLTGVRNQCRNVMERKQVRERFLRLLSEEATEPTIGNSEQLQMSELIKYVEEHLPPLNQQIFRLRYLREMTCQEVADALGIKYNKQYEDRSTANRTAFGIAGASRASDRRAVAAGS